MLSFRAGWKPAIQAVQRQSSRATKSREQEICPRLATLS
jgi:hypothetical protein